MTTGVKGPRVSVPRTPNTEGAASTTPAKPAPSGTSATGTARGGAPVTGGDGFSKKTSATNAAALTGSATRASGIVPLRGTAEAANAPQVGFRLRNPNGELGYLGPLGPGGALGESGPIGKSVFNPSNWITGGLDWSGWASMMTAFGGPLSSMGPLGQNGPLNKSTAQGTVAPLKIGGAEAALGPSGPLGALGPLGPLGPTGAHGFHADANGNYLDASGKQVRTISVDWSLDRKNTEELVEDYSEKRAGTMKDNDTSFMVEGTIGKTGEKDDFHFKSRTDQYVTVLVLPTKGAAPGAMDDFQLELFDHSGKQVGASRLADGPDWVQLKVPAGEELNARVTLNGSVHGGSKPYRLVVVGTGDHTKDMTGGKPWDTGDAKVVAQPH